MITPLVNQAATEATFLWLGCGITLVILLASAALASAMAIPRGLHPGRWFTLGLLLNVFAIAFLLKQKRVDAIPAGYNHLMSTLNPIRCPGCGAENHPTAKQCLGCEKPIVDARSDRKNSNY